MKALLLGNQDEDPTDLPEPLGDPALDNDK